MRMGSVRNMVSAAMAGNRVRHAIHSLWHGLERAVHSGPPDSAALPLVFAVSNCYPTRIVLYAAAFQGGWKVEFFRSLRELLEAARTRTPKAVFYDHTGDRREWDGYCSKLSSMGIPFIVLGHKNCDETFLVLLTHGGYYACGDPLCSEEIVKAVSLAEDVAECSRASVGSR